MHKLLSLPATIQVWTGRTQPVRARMKDAWSKIAEIFNGNETEKKIVLPEGKWQKVSLPGQSSFLHKSFPSIVVPASSCAILYHY